MKLKSFASVPAVLSKCKVAGIVLILVVLSANGFSQDPPLIPRKVFDAPAEHDFLTVSPTEKPLPTRRPPTKGWGMSGRRTSPRIRSVW